MDQLRLLEDYLVAGFRRELLVGAAGSTRVPHRLFLRLHHVAQAGSPG